MGVHKSLSIGLGLVGTFTFAAVALADNPPSEQPNFPPTTNKTEAVVDIPEKLPLFDIEELRSAMMERYLRVKNSASVTQFETQPVSFGDERRESRPEPPLPPYKKSAPDWRCDNWMDTAEEVGWPLEELPKLSYVIYRETRCRPDQHNPDDPMGGSNGLMQINQFWCKSTQYWPEGWLQAQEVLEDCDELYNPVTNLVAGLAIWHNSGWSPWGV
jgi:hypothetical protein